MIKHLLAKRVIVMALLAIAMVSSPQWLYAQRRSVSGVVKADDGTTVPGVSVVERGTTNGTVTDSDGRFSLTVSEGAVLSISFIGMKPVEIEVGNQTEIAITLEADIQQLDEVVVVGYGTVERRDLTSSVSSVSARQLRDIPINSAAEALSGRLAGVQITRTEGSPDAEVLIRVRGGGSITQNNSPLYVVDGIQVENALSVLSPQDIESIDVLKDASATAIYGARGANGVVIITTKGGKKGRTEVTYGGIFGVRQLANKLDVMNPYDFVRYQYERSRGSSQQEGDFLETYGHYEDLELYKQVPFVDWQDEVFGRSAMMQTHNIGVAGGNESTTFNISVTSNTEEGVMLESDFDRKLINARFDHNINSRAKVGLAVRYNRTLVNGAGTATAGSSSVNRLRHSVKYRPILFAGQDKFTYDPEYAGETNANSLSLVNPILLTSAEYRQVTKNVANISGYASYDITKHITFKTSLGVDITNERDHIFNDSITNNSQLNGAGKPIASIQTGSQNIFNNSNVLTFSTSKLKTSFTQKNKIDFLIGQELYTTKSMVNYLRSGNFPNGITPELAFGSMRLGTPLENPTSTILESRLLSFFTRLNYAHDDKYMATLTFRADGSSKFSKTNRWGYFPSASLAWRISSERFMEPLTNTLSDLKLRVSYGESGNNRITDFQYLTQFVAGGQYDINNGAEIGFIPAALANEDLIWETTIARNLGIDAGLFNNRLQLSVDLYRNSTRDLLLNAVVPSTSGYTNQIQNIGETRNSGVEVQLSGAPITRSAFSWNATFNISFNKNRVVSLGGDQDFFLYPSGWGGGNVPADYIVKVGSPVGSIWGLVTDGFYTVDDFNYDNGVYTLKDGVATNQGITSLAPRPGVIKFQDINGDGVINDSDRTIIGDATPKFFGGFNNQFSYRNFDLSIFVNFQYGNDVLNANKLEFTSGYTPNSNLLTMMNNRWTNVNPEGQVVTDPEALRALNADATLWSPLTSASSFWTHSWAVEDGSFIRINNITLGYSIPPSLLNKARISRFRVYATVNNLHVFTKYTGYDPEVSTRRASPITPGVDYAAYPRSVAYVFGVNLTL